MENQTCSRTTISCPLCNCPRFENVHTLRSSLINVASAQLKCPVCSETVMGLDKLTIHLFTHMNENVKQKEVAVVDTVMCDVCNATFVDKTILELHQKLLHQSSFDELSGNNFFHCHLCSKKFKMRGSLVIHLRVAHYGFANNRDGEARNLNVNATENTTVVNDRNLINKQWECDVCSKMFTTKYFLKKHKRLHTGEMPYTCAQCNKSFTFQQSYHKHMLYHSSEKPHTCTDCGRSFKELSTLQNHVRIHSGDRPFACETCGKRFRQRVSYLVHRRIHTGAMPYDCQKCGKKFRYKVSQRSHKCSGENLANDAFRIQNGANNGGKIEEPNVMEQNDPLDLYSLIQSPLRLEVESLCLSNTVDDINHNSDHFLPSNFFCDS